MRSLILKNGLKRILQLINAFTCTGPYAMMILAGVKTVENRSMMPSPFKGHCAMSVSKGFSRQEYSNFILWVNEVYGFDWCRSNLWEWDVVKKWRGCVIATMDYTATSVIPNDEITRKHCACWHEGYSSWWHLSNIKRLKIPIPCKGNFGMWKMDDALAITVSKAELESEDI